MKIPFEITLIQKENGIIEITDIDSNISYQFVNTSN